MNRFDEVLLRCHDRVDRLVGFGGLVEHGRVLFDRSRLRRRSRNDADRLKKYLARYGLDFPAVHDGADPLIEQKSGSPGGAYRSEVRDEPWAIV